MRPCRANLRALTAGIAAWLLIVAFAPALRGQDLAPRAWQYSWVGKPKP